MKRNTPNDILTEKAGEIIELLQNLLAIELWRNGVSQAEIGKRLHVAKATVVKMLKGMKNFVPTKSYGQTKNA